MKLSKELQEVFEKLIPIYEKAIKECPSEGWHRYLYSKGLYHGICSASDEILDIDIYVEMKHIAILLEVAPNSEWHKTIIYCNSNQEAISTLQWRVNKMKELLKLNDGEVD